MPRLLDYPRVCWWAQWFARPFPRPRKRDRLLGAVRSLPWMILLPWDLMLRDLAPWVRVYRTLDGEAMLMIHAKRDRIWQISNFVGSTPGSGKGKELLGVLVPVLVDYVDAHGITLRTTAGHERLATLYEQTVPGLHRTGQKSWRGGIKMMRSPEMATD